MNADILSLVPIYFGPRQELLSELAKRLELSFRMGVRQRPPWFDPEDAFDPARGQYDSTRLLEALLDEPRERGARVLGVSGVDLFIPVLTYVFGEAQLRGRAALVSLHRLRPELYGLPADERLLMERLHKESVHELGHTYGLLHCPEAGCVMHASRYAEEVDLKTAQFCESCRAAVG